jgi:hypothetical protein
MCAVKGSLGHSPKDEVERIGRALLDGLFLSILLGAFEAEE